MRSALFSTIDDTSEGFGSIVETAIFSQWFHSAIPLYYARWNDGEVDMVHVTGTQRANWAVDVKWSDRTAEFPNEFVSLRKFCEENHVREAIVTTKTKRKSVILPTGLDIDFVPASLYCYVIGRRGIHSREWFD